jgi:hypothetical protein
MGVRRFAGFHEYGLPRFDRILLPILVHDLTFPFQDDVDILYVLVVVNGSLGNARIQNINVNINILRVIRWIKQYDRFSSAVGEVYSARLIDIYYDGRRLSPIPASI